MSDDQMQPTDVVTIRPGDKLVFRFTQRLTDQHHSIIHRRIEQQLGPDIPFLILDEPVHLTVLHNGET